MTMDISFMGQGRQMPAGVSGSENAVLEPGQI
jgi:hypothetical protein